MPIGTTLVAAAAKQALDTVKNKAIDKVATGGMDALRNTLKALANASDGSLVGVSQSGRVEPLCLIDAELNGHQALGDTLQSLQAIFAGYYLRAFSLSSDVGGISVAGRLEPMSTSRSPMNAFIVATESFNDRLPMYDGSDARDTSDTSFMRGVVAIESKDDKTSVAIGRDSTSLQDASSLAIGKVVNVTITHNGSSAVVPIAIRLDCNYMASQPMAGLLSGLGADYSISERWMQYRHGGISFWRDFVLCQDIIDEHKSNLKNDKSGIYLAMMQRRSQNNVSTGFSGSVSLNNASNLIIVSKETLNAVEAKLGISFDSFNQRQKIFENGYMMIIAVMDRRWNRVTFYTRGIKNTTTVLFSDLRSIEKNGGSDIGDILAAFRAGTSATL